MMKVLLKKTYKLTNLVIIYQLLMMPLTPYALAQEKESSFWSWDTVKDILPTAVGLTNAFFSNMFEAQNQNQNNSQYDQFYAQFQQQYGIKPVAPTNVEGGLIFNGCFVLEARIDKPNSGAMCNAQPPQANIAGYSGAMAEVMEDNFTTLSNFLIPGNDDFNSQGVGCYDRKIKDFNTLLEQRELEIEKRIQGLKQSLDRFNLLSKADLDAIKKSTAVLDGGPDREEHIGDLKFEDYLVGQDDGGNVCGSVISSSELATAANKSQGGGLRAIEQLMFDKFSKGDGRSTSPEQFLGQATQIRDEVSKLGDLLADDILSSGTGAADLNSVAYRGKILTKNNTAIQNAVNQFNAELTSSFKNLDSDTRIQKKIEGSPGLSKIIEDMKSEKIDFAELETSLKDVEYDFKKSCLVRNVTRIHGSDFDAFGRSFKNPNISNSLNAKNDNALANRITEMLSSDEFRNIDEILDEIEDLQRKGQFSNMIMTTGKTIKVGRKTITASTPLRPAQLLGVYVDNCNKNFRGRAQGNSSRYSLASGIKAVKRYARQRDSITKSAASNVKSNIAKELLTCPSDTTAGKADNSCTNATDTGSVSFCLRTAQRCASNFKGCYEKAKKKVENIVKGRKERIDNYQANVDRFKTQLNQEILAFNAFMEANGRDLDARLNLGTNFGVPDIETKFSDVKRLPASAGVDPKLALEDPAAYVEDAIENLNKIKRTAAEQKEKINRELTRVKNRITDNLKGAQAEVQGIMQVCQKTVADLNQQLAEQEEQKAENNKKISAACQQLQAFGQNPGGVEVDSLADSLSEAVQLAAAIPGDGQFAQNFNQFDQAQIARIRAFNAKCEADAKSANPFLPGVANGLTALNICDKDNRDKVSEMLPNAKVEEVCKATKSKTDKLCEKEEFLEVVRNTLEDGKSICKTNSGVKIITDDESTHVGCRKVSGGDDPQLVDSDEEIIQNASKIRGKISGLCKIAKEDEDTTTIRQHLASAYNCAQVKQKAGQIQVSVCNFPTSNDVNQKGDPLLDLAGAAGKHLGSRRTQRN